MKRQDRFETKINTIVLVAAGILVFTLLLIFALAGNEDVIGLLSLFGGILAGGCLAYLVVRLRKFSRFTTISLLLFFWAAIVICLIMSASGLLAEWLVEFLTSSAPIRNFYAGFVSSLGLTTVLSIVYVKR